jgi:enoyl-CoA hydratase
MVGTTIRCGLGQRRRDDNLMSDNDLILKDRPAEHVLVLTMNRFSRRNSFDRRTAEALEEALDEFEADESLFVGVITGAGGVFSAGQDLLAAKEGELAIAKRRGGFGIMERPPAKPLIAAVEGYALAGGLELALSCDLIVSSSAATMGLPEATWSLVAAGAGLFRLPQRIPYHVAMELALTGATRPATDFHRWGLVNRLAEPGRALEVALGLAAEVLRCGPLAVSASAQIVRRAFDWTEEQAWVEQQAFVDRVVGSADMVEGLTAFAEKRSPVWLGR